MLKKEEAIEIVKRAIEKSTLDDLSDKFLDSSFNKVAIKANGHTVYLEIKNKKIVFHDISVKLKRKEVKELYKLFEDKFNLLYNEYKQKKGINQHPHGYCICGFSGKAGIINQSHKDQGDQYGGRKVGYQTSFFTPQTFGE